jgi:hypothetical protein
LRSKGEKVLSIFGKIISIIAVVAIGASFYHFFIDSMELSMNIILSFLALMYLLFGIEGVKGKDRDKKPAYTYLVVALVLFSGLIMELFKIL